MNSEEQHLRRVRESSSAEFLRLPGITGVGVGPKIVGGRAISKPAVVVFVARKKPMAEIEPACRIPSEIEGIPTDVDVLRGRPVRAAGPWDAPGFWVEHSEALVLQMEDLRPYRHPFLQAGCQIVSERDPGNGTLGFFALTDEDPQRHALVTCHHVLFGLSNATAVGMRVGQPIPSDGSGCCATWIGCLRDSRIDEMHDTAVVIMKPKTKWLQRVLEIGMITGFGVPSPSEIVKVAKRGRSTRVTGGTVRAIDVDLTDADDPDVFARQRTLIKPNPPAGPSSGDDDFPVFTHEGDSGAAVLSEGGQLIGISDGYIAPEIRAEEIRRPDGTLETIEGYGLVVQIDRILEDFGLQVPVHVSAEDVQTVPENQVLPGVAPPSDVDLRKPARLGDFERGLRRSPEGTALLSSYQRYADEVRDLVQHNPRVAAVWHRTGMPGLVQAVMRMAGDPQRRLPANLRAGSLEACLERTARMLSIHGSEALGHELRYWVDQIPAYRDASFQELLAQVQRRGREKRADRGEFEQ